MEGAEDVSPAEFAKWFEVFSLFDEDGSACIKTSVLGHVVRDLDRMPSEGLLKQMIEEVDTDGNGSVDVDEFVQVMLKHPEVPRQPEVVSAALQEISRAEKGTIGLAELRRHLTQTGECLSEEEVGELEALLVPHVDFNGAVSIAKIADILCHPE